MTRRSPRGSGPSLLPADSLSNSIDVAATLVSDVIAGTTLTRALEARRNAHHDTATNWGAIQDLAYGTLRDFGRGDTLLRILLKKPLDEPLQSIFRVALHRLEKRPDQAHLIVDQSVEAFGARAPGLRGVANGVLRNFVRQFDALRTRADDNPVALHRHPAWWIKRLRASYPQDWQAILAAGNTHPPMCLRVNPRRIDRADALGLLADASIRNHALPNGALLLDAPRSVDRIPGFADGIFSVQDAGAQWAAGYLDPQPGERVLDACAAPGGKTAQLLENYEIDLTALELDPLRARRITANLDRLGLSAHLAIGDCRSPADWWDGRPYQRILADVPCSASGVVRRHPDIKWLRRASDIDGFARQQAEILDALWQTLAPGGTMLYVTCSVFVEENSTQINRFCARHVDATRIPIEDQSERILLPAAEHDGFYYALLEKTP